MKTLTKIFAVIWQLPQYIIGLGLVLATDAIYDEYNGVYFAQRGWFGGGISLGGIIILSKSYEKRRALYYESFARTVAHEKGHTKQSLILGPLYLLIIGIPSFLWATVHSVLRLKCDYYSFPTECWANKLAGIK